MEKSKDKKIFYGWWIVVGGIILNFMGLGIGINAIGVFFKPVVSDLGFSRGDFSLYFTILALTMTFASPLLGKLLEKYKISKVMGISTLLLSCGFAAYSQCSTLTEFYIVSVVVGLGHAGTHILPVSMLITNWFNKKRGLAMGIVFTASGIGGMVFSPLANHLIEIYGWRNSYLILGIALAVMCIPTTFFMKKTPEELGLFPDGAENPSETAAAEQSSGFSLGQVVKSPVFWLLAVMIFLIDAQAMGIQQHLVPYLTDIKYTPTFAATILGFYLGMIAVGKVILGYISDKYSVNAGFSIFTFILALSMVFLYEAKIVAFLIAFAVAFGFGNAVITVSLPLMTAECFGLAHYGVIFGMLTIANALGAAIGMPVVGYLYDSTGSYDTAITISLVITIIALVFGFIGMKMAGPRLQALQAEEKLKN